MTFRFYTALIFLITILFLSGCGGGGGSSHSGHSVSYVVTSSSIKPLEINYLDQNGDTRTVSDVYLTNTTWSFSFSAPGDTYLSVAAMIQDIPVPPDVDTDNIFNLFIYVDGTEVKRGNLAAAGVLYSIDYTIPSD